ncbi:hypothetical protein ASPBRDRAFT_45387 [Aspergillus brasiliensis CBS 101740]|uniref:Methyltransferase domain-containing protein n=1 Tax=Aspergillus brasiliensis (strain CBS 101740 / IMI 381727 / IBT 21946) TaxID=767769 RepID=A0A1L9UEE2_ASPBC|nr:hypothetical protein ASPBRDRAFT_45387 [Aspergillus brasiliensis CBS 101740]
MAPNNQAKTYTQGYSSDTVATQQTRTAESEAAFLLPHLRSTDHILDVGCGPGTITIGFTRYATEGRTVGVDISSDVLRKAKSLAAEAGCSMEREQPGSVVFEEGDILKGLPYPDETFDVVYCAQLFGYLPPPDLPLTALSEMRRVLKPGGILATRDAADQHFYPRSLNLDRLWVQNFNRAVHWSQGSWSPDADTTATIMPALFRRAGFNADAGGVRISVGTTLYSGRETREWLARRAESQLQQGDPLRQSWLRAGITEEEIEHTLLAVRKWAETEDAWYAALQCEVLGWK